MRDPARLVFPGFTVGAQDPAQALALARLGVGGFCLYRGTPASIASLTRRLRAAAPGPLLICADYEEGAWMHARGATPLPTSLGVGASASTAVAREKGRLTAREARAMGVDWVLAPVADLADEPANPIVNLRAFSDRPAEAARLARAFLAGLREEGALGCLKHFPGHGRTRADSHIALPVVRGGRGELSRRELAPFRALARGADAVMLGHLVVPGLDRSGLPFTLSPAGPRLLASWGFRGIVATDALDMGALKGLMSEREAALRAVRAGAHALLVPRDPRALVAELRVEAGRDASLAGPLAEAHRRLDAALRRVRGPRPPRSVVAGAAHRARAAALMARCLAWKSGPAAPVRRVAYFEPQAGPRGPLSGAPFVAALARAGARVRAARDGEARPGETLVAGAFVGPRAYSGRIRLDPRAARALRAALAAAPSALAVSFGSPFVLDGLPRRAAALGAFSSSPAAQAAAAAVVAGRARAPGRWPVGD